MLTVLTAAIIYTRRPGDASPPKTWLEPRAFVIATFLMAIVQFSKLVKYSFQPEEIAIAIVICIFGGGFWGAIGTYFYNRSRRQP